MVTMYVKIGQRRGVKYLRIEEYIVTDFMSCHETDKLICQKSLFLT